MITANQLKAARALLEMKQTELAEKAGVSVATINNFERGKHKNLQMDTVQKIKKVLKDAGIEFTNNEGTLGVQLQHRGNVT